ncbi:MAG: histidine kinase N-terminal 7TM domain-containing protein [Chloroflexota bacterium]
MQLSLYAVLQYLSGTILLSLGIYGLRFRQVRTALPFAITMLLGANWAVGQALNLSSNNLNDKIFWYKFSYPGIVFLPVIFLVTVLILLGQDRWLRWQRLAPAFIVPLISVPLAWTMEFHTFFRYNFRLETTDQYLILRFSNGFWYGVQIFQGVTITLITMIILAYAAFGNKKIYSRQALMLLIGSLLPFIGDILYVFNLSPVLGIDPGPSLFVITGLSLAWAIFRYQMLELVPIGYHRVVENISDLILILDAKERLVDFNPAAQEIFGLNKDQVLGKPLVTILGQWSELLDYYQVARESKEIWLGTPENRRIYDTSVTLIKNKRQNLTGKIILLHNITALKRTEQALEIEKERLAITLRSSGEGIITTDVDDRIDLINQAAENLTGWQQTEASGLPIARVFQIIDAKTREPRPNPLPNLNLDSPVRENIEDVILVGRESYERYINYSSALIQNKEGKRLGTVLIFRDVTEKRKMIEEQTKANNLEALGVLAGGIAHDFNNILTAIMGNLMLARGQLASADELHSYLDNAEKASLRAKALARQLLTFAKGGAPVKKQSSLAEILQENAQFVLHGSNVEGKFDLPETLWPIEVDRGQISQVIQNLVLNAIQSMPKGGKIVLKAENVWLMAETVPLLEPGGYVKLIIEDEGPGIKAADLHRIFDPYFTTKQQNSGLGLTICYSIVRKHNGQILVDSALGKGTTITMYLPLATQKLSEKETKSFLIDSSPNNNRRMLIMDDEPMVRSVTSKVFQKKGYEVTTAQDGAEAIEEYQKAMETGQPFEIVIMDLTIPGGMGGKEATEKILKLDPQAKIIVASGYSSDPVMADHQKYGFVGMISKPFTIASLEKVINQVTSTDWSLGRK